jgi:hypothetical protein
MAIATGTAIALGGGALLGGIAGSQGQRQTSERTIGPESLLGARLGGFTQSQHDALNAAWARGDTAEVQRLQKLKESGGEVGQQYSALGDMVNAGPGMSDVTRGLESQRSLADLYRQYAEGGYNPTAQDISSSQTLAQSLFNPQRIAMQQAFQDQSTEANRRAAVMGRSMNDPILAAKLAQEQTRQSSMLEANQGAWSTQYSMQQPMMRLGFKEQQTNVLQGLASQAMQNRQTLLGIGSGLLNSERNFQMGQGTTTTTSGGGFGGFLQGAMGGAGTAMSAYGSMSQANYFDAAAKNLTPPAPGGGGQVSAQGMYSGGSSNPMFQNKMILEPIKM